MGTLFLLTGMSCEQSGQKWQSPRGLLIGDNVLGDVSRKAPDERGMVAELYKEGGEGVAEQLTELFNEVVRTRSPPEEWANIIFVMIHKAGEIWRVDNYRPVALLNVG
jgi:hypothetical protein